MDIFVRDNVKLRMKARHVVPSFGQLTLGCQCGSKAWRVHVLPAEQAAPLVTEIVCEGCERLFSVDSFSRLQATGRI